MANVIVYSTPTCGWCHRVKDYFKENNIEFVVKDVSVDEQAREEMFAKTQQMGVPVIDIDNNLTIGFDQPRLAYLLGR